MDLHIYDSKRSTSEAAADRAAETLMRIVERTGEATFVVATGASQFDFLDALTSKNSVPWERTTMFHLDEYIGLSSDHSASFRNYLHERLLSQVDLGTSHLIRGGAEDPKAECARLNRLIEDVEVDAAFVGIGENGHLAFNDPPADFEIEQPFITVELDDDGRKQQVDEGWFETLGDVPERAITMSISQVMAANEIICTVPHERKADAAKDCFKGPVSPEYPASILQEHDQVHVYLDEASASLLSDAE